MTPLSGEGEAALLSLAMDGTVKTAHVAHHGIWFWFADEMLGRTFIPTEVLISEHIEQGRESLEPRLPRGQMAWVEYIHDVRGLRTGWCVVGRIPETDGAIYYE